MDLAAYRPLSEYEDGLTPFQIQERRHSVRKISLLLYDAEMSQEKAEVVMQLTATELMSRLDLDEEQANDLKDLAWQYLERREMAGVNAGGIENGQ